LNFAGRASGFTGHFPDRSTAYKIVWDVEELVESEYEVEVYDTCAEKDLGSTISLAFQGRRPEGRILILGSFSSVAGTNRNQLARLNSDGSLDRSFDPGAGPMGTLSALRLLADGRILVGGNFETFQGFARPDLARLNPDGALDQGFRAPLFYSSVNALGVSATGDIYAGGRVFLDPGENGSPSLAKLHLDGSVNAAFFRLGLQAWPADRIRFIESLSDGTLLVGGDFLR